MIIINLTRVKDVKSGVEINARKKKTDDNKIAENVGFVVNVI